MQHYWKWQNRIGTLSEGTHHTYHFGGLTLYTLLRAEFAWKNYSFSVRSHPANKSIFGLRGPNCHVGDIFEHLKVSSELEIACNFKFISIVPITPAPVLGTNTRFVYVRSRLAATDQEKKQSSPLSNKWPLRPISTHHPHADGTNSIM